MFNLEEETTEMAIELLAQELASNWVDNYTLTGATLFLENEAKKKAIIDDAIFYGIYENVYARANDILHGDK